MLKKRTFVAALLAVISMAVSQATAQKTLAVKGGTVHTMNGKPIENGVILFRDGKILDVGKDLKIPVEAQVIDASGKIVMPGFVEAHSSSGMSQANETNQNVPYVSVLDSIDPMNSYFRSARRQGITSVAITPGNSTMIGGQAAVIKTGGEFVDYMVLKADSGVKISMRPVSGSRMGHLSRLHKAFEDAKEKMEKQAKEKKDEKKDEKKPKKATEISLSALDKAMFALLKGKLPAIIYCEQPMDVDQAMRLIKKFNLKARLVVGPNCYKATKQIAESKLPVILDANTVFWEEDPRTKEEKKIVLTEEFRNAKIPFVFQAGRGSSLTQGQNFLWYQAATAVKYGMPAQEALQALTLLPAKFLGVDKFVGSIEKGKDGDVIILSGDPLKVTTWVDTTIVNGEVVYERDNDEQLKMLLTGSNDEADN